ncbi:hypothetical protein V6N13_085933 [Hibiscus sabdariffa]
MVCNNRYVRFSSDLNLLKPWVFSAINWGLGLNCFCIHGSGLEDASEGAVVQRGRFKVTSADLSPKPNIRKSKLLLSFVTFYHFDCDGSSPMPSA